MKQLISLIFTCTDREALNLAVFFHENFIIIERWRVRCFTNSSVRGDQQ